MKKNTAKIGIFTLGFILLATNAISPAMNSIREAFPDVPVTTINMILLLPQLISVPFVLFGGAIAGRFSKKRLILISLVMFSLGGVTGFFVESVPVILVSRCIYGIGYGLLVPCSLGIASDIFYGTDEYDHVVGVQYSLKSIGSIFYSLLAGWLCAFSWHHTFLLYLTGMVVFFIILFAVPDISPKELAAQRPVEEKQSAKGGKLQIPAILIPAICIGFAYSFCSSVSNSNTSFLVEGSGFGSSMASGVISALSTASSAAGAWAYDRILKLIGEKTYVFGIFCSAAGLFLGAFAKNIVMVALCMILFGFGLGITNPALLMLVGKNSQQSSTLFFSFVMAAMNLGAMAQGYVIPVIGSAIFGGDGTGDVAFLLGGIGTMLCFIAGIFMLIKFGHKEEKA